MKIAVIPARGGSKRIPRKNIRVFAGKPMIHWPIEAALQSGLFDDVIVSTDDEEIASIAQEAGAHVPFMRPKSLADDHTGTIAVMAHAMDWADQSALEVEAACCIYATAPTIDPADLAAGLKLLLESGKDFAFASTDFASPIFRAFRQAEDGGTQMFWPDKFATRSQDLPRALHDAAQFYWGLPRAWQTTQSLFGSNAAPLIIPRWKVQDIDTLDDWVRAEALFRSLKA